MVCNGFSFKDWPFHIMTYCAGQANWLHLVPLWRNVIGLLLMREFWGEQLNEEGASGGKVTHSYSLGFFRAEELSCCSCVAGRSKKPCNLLLTVKQWWCRRFKSSQFSRTILCIHQCMYNVNTEDFCAWFGVDSCMYICRLVYCVNTSINILDFMVPVPLNYLNVIKSYMSSAGAKYADIMA